MQFIFYIIGVIQVIILLCQFFFKFKPKFIYLFIAIFILSIISGLRYEVGMDWEGYEKFFQSVNGIQNENIPIMEIGFEALNKIIGLFTENYGYVFLFSSLSFGGALGLLYKNLGAKFYVYALSCFIGYSFLIIGFAQVRQGLAISIILVGVYFYNFKRLSGIFCFFIASLSLLFQLSSLIYLALIIITILNVYFIRSILYKIILLILLIFILSIGSNLIFDILKEIALSENIYNKISNYSESNVEESVALYINLMIILVNSFIVLKYSRLLSDVRAINMCSFYFVLNLSCVLSVLALPGVYVFYSRLYLLSSLLLPVVFYLNRTVINSKKLNLILFLNSLIYLINYFKSIIAHNEAFSNYKTFL